MKLESIRQEVSQYLDILIPENQWESKLDVLDKEGAPTKKQMLGLFLILFKHVEALENKVSGQETQFSRLKTGEDVVKSLEGKEGAQYVSNSDWELLKKRSESSHALDPQYNMGKEVDPRDGKQKSCFYVGDNPVFKL